jgi:hypothetical protein
VARRKIEILRFAQDDREGVGTTVREVKDGRVGRAEG